MSELFSVGDTVIRVNDGSMFVLVCLYVWTVWRKTGGWKD